MSDRPSIRERARRRLARIRERVEWVDLDLCFVNLESYRRDAVRPEIEAILEVWQPDVLAGCEGIGNNLPRVRGYRRFHYPQGDTPLSRSRANVWAYVRADLPSSHRYVDLKGTWPRTNNPSQTHEARSILVLDVAGIQIPVAHQAPKNARGSWVLQAEGVMALARIMTPWKRREWRKGKTLAQRVIARLRPRIVLWDSNARSGEARPGPDSLAKRIGGTVHGGERVDNGVSRGQIKIRRVWKRAKVRGVKIDTDHGGAIRFRAAVRSFWLRRKDTR